MMESFPNPVRKKGVPLSEQAASHEYFRSREGKKWSTETSQQRNSGGSEAYRTGFDEDYFDEDGVRQERRSLPIEELGVAGIGGKPLEEGVDPFESIDEGIDDPKILEEMNLEELNLEHQVEHEKAPEFELDETQAKAAKDLEDKIRKEVEEYAPVQQGGNMQTREAHIFEPNKGHSLVLNRSEESRVVTPRYKTFNNDRISDKVANREFSDDLEELEIKYRPEIKDKEAHVIPSEEDKAA